MKSYYDEIEQKVTLHHNGIYMVFYKNELFKLPTDIIKRGLERGKGLKRGLANESRQADGLDRYDLADTLRGYKNVDDLLMNNIENMKIEEIKLGIIEYLSTLRG